VFKTITLRWFNRLTYHIVFCKVLRTVIHTSRYTESKSEYSFSKGTGYKLGVLCLMTLAGIRNSFPSCFTTTPRMTLGLTSLLRVAGNSLRFTGRDARIRTWPDTCVAKAYDFVGYYLQFAFPCDILISEKSLYIFKRWFIAIIMITSSLSFITSKFDWWTRYMLCIKCITINIYKFACIK